MKCAPPVENLDTGGKTLSVGRASMHEDHVSEFPCSLGGCHVSVSISEIGDERASPLQNEEVHYENWELPVKLEKSPCRRPQTSELLDALLLVGQRGLATPAPT